jgi:hypothetical protein
MAQYFHEHAWFSLSPPRSDRALHEFSTEAGRSLNMKSLSPNNEPKALMQQPERGAIGPAFLVWLLGGGLGLAILVFLLLKVF